MRKRLPTSRIVVALALIALTACGAPQRLHTLGDEPDLARIRNTIPAGFSSATDKALAGMRATCSAIDAAVGTQLPDAAPRGGVSHLALVDWQCQWTDAPSSRAPGVPTLIIGLLDTTGGGAALDATASILDDERSVAGIGQRAVFDPQTRTLYVLEHDRLWYLQIVGTPPAPGAEPILATLGRALVQTSYAR